MTLEEIVRAAPEIILLPSEPYEFGDAEKAKIEDWLSETPAVQRGNVHLVDGSLLNWPGTRMARALSELPQFLRP